MAPFNKDYSRIFPWGIVISAIRVMLAIYLWYPLFRMLHPSTAAARLQGVCSTSCVVEFYLLWLTGWNSRLIIHFHRYIFVLWEMQAYISRASSNNAVKQQTIKTAKESLHDVMGLFLLLLMAAAYYFFVNLVWALPEVPTYLLMSSYNNVLMAIGLNSVFKHLGSWPDLETVLFLARMVLLFPIRQLLPWSAAKDLFYYVTRQHHLLQNETWLEAELPAGDGGGGKNNDETHKPTYPMRTVVNLTFSVAVASLFWGTLCWFRLSASPPFTSTSATGGSAVIQAFQLLLWVPWRLATYPLTVLLDRRAIPIHSADTSKIKLYLRWSGNMSLILALMVPAAQDALLPATWDTLLGRAALSAFFGAGSRRSNLHRLAELHVPALQHVFGLLLFPLGLAMAGASRDELLLAGRLLLRVPDTVLFPRLQLAALYDYFYKSPGSGLDGILSDKQSVASNPGETDKEMDQDKKERLLDEKLHST